MELIKEKKRVLLLLSAFLIGVNAAPQNLTSILKDVPEELNSTELISTLRITESEDHARTTLSAPINSDKLLKNSEFEDKIEEPIDLLKITSIVQEDVTTRRTLDVTTEEKLIKEKEETIYRETDAVKAEENDNISMENLKDNLTYSAKVIGNEKVRINLHEKMSDKSVSVGTTKRDLTESSSPFSTSSSESTSSSSTTQISTVSEDSSNNTGKGEDSDEFQNDENIGSISSATSLDNLHKNHHESSATTDSGSQGISDRNDSSVKEQDQFYTTSGEKLTTAELIYKSDLLKSSHVEKSSSPASERPSDIFSEKETGAARDDPVESSKKPSTVEELLTHSFDDLKTTVSDKSQFLNFDLQDEKRSSVSTSESTAKTETQKTSTSETTSVEDFLEKGSVTANRDSIISDVSVESDLVSTFKSSTPVSTTSEEPFLPNSNLHLSAKLPNSSIHSIKLKDKEGIVLSDGDLKDVTSDIESEVTDLKLDVSHSTLPVFVEVSKDKLQETTEVQTSKTPEVEDLTEYTTKTQFVFSTEATISDIVDDTVTKEISSQYYNDNVSKGTSTDAVDLTSEEQKSVSVDTSAPQQSAGTTTAKVTAFASTLSTDPRTETTYKEPVTEAPIKSFVDDQEFDELQDRYVSGNNSDMIAAVQFLHYHDKASSDQCYKLVSAYWNYATNLTEENKKKQLEQMLEYSFFHKEAWKNATSFAWKSFNDTLLKRWFTSLSVLGTAALPENKLNELNRLKAEMRNTYSTAKVCDYVSPELTTISELNENRNCSLALDPDIQRILVKSRDYDELAHFWKSWRDSSGKPIKKKFLRFVNLSNEAAVLNGFRDTGDLWKESYESPTFVQDLSDLWKQLEPLYKHLHAYVRRKLIQVYGEQKIKEDGPIPAHLFGNMWAQSWVSTYDITQPYPGKPTIDVTPAMESKNMTALEMFKISEEFFTSLGLKPMPEEFWKHSLIEKPKDREIICHASAWDFCNGKDYRIKQCTDITMVDLITVHHEMGHVQYFLQYARQPNVFREGANPGFHEAIGDVLALSVSTPQHLQKIGLLETVADDPEGDLNFLLRTALEKISFLPFGYLIDLWRWGLFSGEIKPEEMNTKWWELRLKYQGVCPPVKRTEDDFDPGAKYHVPGNVPYIRYFVSFVIQFQFHKVLCDAAGHQGPLHKCDIYNSKEAGQILSQVMELGSSEHWSDVMKIMTGGATNKMDAQPILEYFEPLLNFLMEQNRNETIGWQSLDPTICP